MSLSEIGRLEDRLRDELGRFLLAIQTERVVDLNALQKVDHEAADIARHLKGEALVPKSLLRELRFGIKILRAEAPYVRGETSRLNDLADKLEMTFDLILLDESYEDRVPGVPRVL
jgi:hypothetical protein